MAFDYVVRVRYFLSDFVTTLQILYVRIFNSPERILFRQACAGGSAWICVLLASCNMRRDGFKLLTTRRCESH